MNLSSYHFILVEYQVTHQHQYVGESRCLLISEGRIKIDGTYADCVAGADGRLDYVTFNKGDSQSTTVSIKIKHSPTTEETTFPTQNERNDTEATKQTRNSEQQETKVTGIVSKATFLHYARAMGGYGVATCLLLLLAICQAGSLVCVAFLGRWSQRSYIDQVSNDQLSSFKLGWLKIDFTSHLIFYACVHNLMVEILGYIRHCYFTWSWSSRAGIYTICGVSEAKLACIETASSSNVISCIKGQS